MFVKIINHSEKIAPGFPQTKCYDCKKYLITNHVFPPDAVRAENGPKQIDVIIDVGEQTERVLSIPMKKHSIIVMNNEGKTIDHYSF